MTRNRVQLEFGDFQTPRQLANDVCSLLEDLRPASIVEPTCGVGSLVLAAAQRFPGSRVIGLDINERHLAVTREKAQADAVEHVELQLGDFFEIEWRTFLDRLAEPILVLGNPPWVTSSALGVLGSTNIPTKSNFQFRRGIDAITGKANFDISEWMVIRLFEACNQRHACVAMLLKTTVARKVLFHAWKRALQLGSAEIRNIDAGRYFGASVAACLLVARFMPGTVSAECHVYPSLSARAPLQTIGFHNGNVIADLAAYRQWAHLEGENSRWLWRSGIKHDCSSVMEFRNIAGRLTNKAGQVVELEPDYLYPMLKSSDLAAGIPHPKRWMLVPQRAVGEPTDGMAESAPKTWQYLRSHGDALGGRRSSIYKGQPQFSIFGVGEYSFAPWKVAVSGLYKHLSFRVVGPYRNRPVVLDDTSYFLPCDAREEAELLAELLNSGIAQNFYRSFTFWDAKRPVTADLLRRLSLLRIAQELQVAGKLAQFTTSTGEQSRRAASSSGAELSLF